MAAGFSRPWFVRSSTRAIELASNSRQRAVRFSGRGSVVDKIRSTSESMFFKASMLARLDSFLMLPT
jgi:hypothetical protein